MNEVAIVIISIIILIVGVIVYGVISTTMGTEEDVNNNYIPDRFERMIGKDPTKKNKKTDF
jgi:p-aminobenzoyl-glutamate transporter AbgT